ncbi:MAG: cobyrinic acid a,c-diamide synthase, partial [Alphaproteobacteria bacterium]
MADGLVIAAPASGSGKTLVTLALLRALARKGIAVASAKIGPDYIDPKFHEAATGRPCFNLDAWAMSPSLIASLAAETGSDAEFTLIEGVMGLFDGPESGRGSTADLAEDLALPVILIIDCSHQAQSIAALVAGFRTYLAPSDVAVLGAIPRNTALTLPSRHLGLVQASEHGDLLGFLDRAVGCVASHVDIDGLLRLAKPLPKASAQPALPPLGQRMAIARDEAFAFLYPHLLSGWRRRGADLSFFSPLANEAPAPDADAIYLPGGYPELHAERLSHADGFRAGLRGAADKGRLIYGECGGYMVLGRSLIDAEGKEHPMSGLLPVTTSFAR